MPEAVHRTPRVRPAGPARTTFDVPALPSLDPPVPLQPVQLLLPVLGSLSILVYGVMARTAVLLVTGGIMALASLASPVVLHWSNRRARRATLARRRERYRVRLAELTEAVEVAQSQLREALSRPHPVPRAYGAWAGSSRLWERRLEDGDALLVRLGTADIPTGFTVAQPAPAPVDAEPDAELLREVEEFLAFAARSARRAARTRPRADRCRRAHRRPFRRSGPGAGARRRGCVGVRARRPHPRRRRAAVRPGLLVLDEVAPAHARRRVDGRGRAHARDHTGDARAASRGRPRSTPAAAGSRHLDGLPCGVPACDDRRRPVRSFHRDRDLPAPGPRDRRRRRHRRQRPRPRR